jgi:hypothetical protein
MTHLCAVHARRKEHVMLDLVVVAIALVMFALAVGYTLACEKL